jgi:type VI secretion system protein ImpF
MAGPSKSDRLSPPLMFAFREARREKDSKKPLDLRDDAGVRVIAGRRTTKGAVTEIQLRAQLSRDLNTLLNTVNLDSAIDLSEHPRVRESILNFGIPEISDRTIDENRTSDIVTEIEIALLSFEPRLVRNTIKVRRDDSVSIDSLSIRFVVTGEMSCDPAAVPVEFVADLELDSGKLAISGR